MKDIAVVTGASGGIGRAIAKKIHEASEGALRLALHYNGNKDRAEAVKAEIPDSFLIQADLGTPAGRQSLLADVLKAGTPYILINNAGIDRPHEPAMNLKEDSFDKLVSVNLKSPLFLMRDFGKEMVRSEGGMIINISSVLAHKSLVGSAIYRATKAGLEALTKQFAFELGPRGVRVNAVSPGFIDTPMTAILEDDMKAQIKAEVALERFGSPEAVAAAVCHIIDNDYINGAIISVDGGMAL